MLFYFILLLFLSVYVAKTDMDDDIKTTYFVVATVITLILIFLNWG